MLEKRLYAKFLSDDILVEQGRLLYAVLYAFSVSGYHIELYDAFDPEKLGRCGKLVPSMANVTMTQAPPAQPEACIYLYDREDRSLASLNWLKKIRIDDNIFSPYCGEDPLIMPYAMHPRQTVPATDVRLQTLRKKARKIRVFFSGDTKDYGRNRIRYPSSKLPRLEVVNTVLEHLPKDVLLVQDAATRDGIFASNAPFTKRCVIMDTGHIWIDEPVWLDTLAAADFFLSPPGIVMPMCHNIIEAMAVGTIPITNYPEWLRPNLVHMENCIVFDGKDDLVQKTRLALTLDENEIARMRANVIDYYRKYLEPQVFVRDLEERRERKLTVLLYTEKNVRENWPRLNRHSVLMRHRMSADSPSRVKCLLSTLPARIFHGIVHRY